MREIDKAWETLEKPEWHFPKKSIKYLKFYKNSSSGNLWRMSLFDRVVFVHMWPFLDYSSQLAVKHSCKKHYEWAQGLKPNLPDFNDFYFENLFETAPASLYRCKPSQFIDDTLVWVYRNGETLLQVYFRMIRIGQKLFPALWHIKLDFRFWGEPGSKYCMRGYRVANAVIGDNDDVEVPAEQLVLYEKYKKQIAELDYEKIWPGCHHNNLQPESACQHGICHKCECLNCGNNF